jgi:hypothetical protein
MREQKFWQHELASFLLRRVAHPFKRNLASHTHNTRICSESGNPKRNMKKTAQSLLWRFTVMLCIGAATAAERLRRSDGVRGGDEDPAADQIIAHRHASSFVTVATTDSDPESLLESSRDDRDWTFLEEDSRFRFLQEETSVPRISNPPSDVPSSVPALTSEPTAIRIDDTMEPTVTSVVETPAPTAGILATPAPSAGAGTPPPSTVPPAPTAAPTVATVTTTPPTVGTAATSAPSPGTPANPVCIVCGEGNVIGNP